MLNYTWNEKSHTTRRQMNGTYLYTDYHTHIYDVDTPYGNLEVTVIESFFTNSDGKSFHWFENYIVKYPRFRVYNVGWLCLKVKPEDSKEYLEKVIEESWNKNVKFEEDMKRYMANSERILGTSPAQEEQDQVPAQG